VAEIQHQLEAIVESGVPGVVVVSAGPGGRVEAAVGVADAETGELRRRRRARVAPLLRLTSLRSPQRVILRQEPA
jgi:hypothetical protein